MNAGGFDEGHLCRGDREPVDEDLGGETRLQVDLQDCLGERRIAGAGAERLDDWG